MIRRRPGPRRRDMRARGAGRRLGFEALEGRALLATFTVTDVGDLDDMNNPVPGSLRAAILGANATPGRDTIAFAIPGDGVLTIRPAEGLPTITDPVIIDGYTQPGARPNGLAVGDDADLRIELDGSVPTATGASGLTIVAGGSVVRGLVVNRFINGCGIALLGEGGNLVEGNFLGTDPSGTVGAGNGFEGVFIEGSSENTVGGATPAARNLISGNFDVGIYIRRAAAPAMNNLVQGNIIGLDASESDGLSNVFNGVRIESSQNRVVGNVIAGNGSEGILILGPDATDGPVQGNLIQGNIVGTNHSGAPQLGNMSDGVSIFRASETTIGGTTPEARNVFSGNIRSGVALRGRGGPGNNVVQGNYIGSDPNGTSCSPNLL